MESNQRHTCTVTNGRCDILAPVSVRRNGVRLPRCSFREGSPERLEIHMEEFEGSGLNVTGIVIDGWLYEARIVESWPLMRGARLC